LRLRARFSARMQASSLVGLPDNSSATMASTTENLISRALHIQKRGIKMDGEGNGELGYEPMMATFILNRFLVHKI